MFLLEMLINLLFHYSKFLFDPTEDHLFGFGNALNDEVVPIIDSLQYLSLYLDLLYAFRIVLFQLRDGSIDKFLDFSDRFVYAKIGRFGFEILMVLGVFANASGTKRHKAVFWVRGGVLSLQKLVIAWSLW